METLKNGWVQYWKQRVEDNADYYGKHGSNANKIIKTLKINKNDRVFDIGCANGSYLTDIHKKTNAKCSGIDISPVAIGLNKDKNIRIWVADMEKTGAKSGYYNKIFSLGTMEHNPNSHNVFVELWRIMKKGGLAYITIPNKISLFHITKNIKMRIGLWDLGYEKSFTYWGLKEELEPLGLKIEQYWIEPHLQIANVFNFTDNVLNKLNHKLFGFFIHMVVRKVK